MIKHSIGPTLETERLILRPPALIDLGAWTAMMQNEEVAQFIGGVASRNMCWRHICLMSGSWIEQGFAMFSVIEKSSKTWIGRIGPWQPEGWPGTEIGWGLARSFWGKGYAYEACVASANWTFDVLKWNEMVHTIDKDNINSVKLAKKLGSYYLRPGKIETFSGMHDIEIWGQTREQWQARQRT